MTSTLITNGLVVTAAESMHADVLIEDGRVAALLDPAKTADLGVAADQVIDAGGRIVAPGGIDAHTHMELPFGGTYAADTFETGSRAAAWGGTTTILDFAVQTKGESAMDGFERWMAKAEGECAVDYGFHMITGDINEQTLKEMDMLVDEGVTSFKMFMAYPGVFYSTDGEIVMAMQKAAENGSVIAMHAENGIAIDVFVRQALQRGETDPIYHGLVRRSALEGGGHPPGHPSGRSDRSGALHRSPVGHGSPGPGDMGPGRRPQSLRRNLPPVPLPGPGRSGQRVRRGQIRVLAAVAGPDGGPPGTAVEGAADRRPAGGFHRPLPVLHGRPPRFRHAEAAGAGQLLRHSQRPARGGEPDGADLRRRSDGGAHRPEQVRGDNRRRPAKMFGLYPKKGTIAVGSDADIIIIDPDRTHTISAATHHMDVDYSAYEGQEVTGKVETVLSKGKVIVSDGRYHGSKGDGEYLHRGAGYYI